MLAGERRVESGEALRGTGQCNWPRALSGLILEMTRTDLSSFHLSRCYLSAARSAGWDHKSPRIWSRDASANCSPQICQNGASCGLQNTPKSVFARALPWTPLGELTTLPRPHSRMGRGHPSPYLTPLGSTDPPSALAVRPPEFQPDLRLWLAALRTERTSSGNGVILACRPWKHFVM